MSAMKKSDGENIFGRRLKNARTMLGLSMDEVVCKMGDAVSKMTISKYERGETIPGSAIVIKFSNALNKTPDYFFRPFRLSMKSINFRKRTSLSVKDCNAIKEKVSDYAERYSEIEEICVASKSFEIPFKSSIFNDTDVINAAKALRKEWNIGDDGIVNIIELLEGHGVKVLEIDAPAKFDGLSSLINDSFPMIVVNSNFDSERKRFTCLHELGHIMLSLENIALKEQERLCNLFANEMLVPSDFFKSIIGEKRHDISYIELKNFQEQFGISIDALMFKARYNEIISERRYKQYFITKNSNFAFKSAMEKSLFPDVHSGRFKSLVYKALSSELITASKAASLLNTSVGNVRKEFLLV